MTEVGAPAINCVFTTDCIVTAPVSRSTFALPGTNGTATLLTRTFQGGLGAPAADKYGYRYQIDMANVTAGSSKTCVSAFSLDFGPVLTFAYRPDVPAQVYVVNAGGLGSIGPSSASISGKVVTFNFARPVCPGESSYFIGLTSSLGPLAVYNAVLAFSSGKSATVQTMVPAERVFRDLSSGRIRFSQPGGTTVAAPVAAAATPRQRQ